MALPQRAPSRPGSTAPPSQLHPGSRQAPSPIDEAYAGLVRSIAFLLQILQPQSQSTLMDILSQINTVLSNITDFRQRLNQTDPDQVNLDEGRWLDKLDSGGTQVWNQSTIRKYTHQEGDCIDGIGGSTRESDYEEIIVAKLRIIGCKLIFLGAVEGDNQQVMASILNLSTKAALACLSLAKPDKTAAQELVTEGTNLVRSLGTLSPTRPSPTNPHPPTSEPAKAVLGHFLARARLSTIDQNDTVASYSMNQIKTNLEMSGCLAGRERLKLAQTSHELGRIILTQSREHRNQAQLEQDDVKRGVKRSDAIKRVDSARTWLMWAVAVLDDPSMQQTVPHSDKAADLKVSSLRLLAQAYLEAEPPLLAEGEATLETLLEADPTSPSLFRRFIRLLSQRTSDQNRIVGAFSQAIEHLPWTESEGFKLLGEVHHLSVARASVKYPVLNALADGALARLNEARDVRTSPGESESAAEDGFGPVMFLGQMVMMIMFAVGPDDYLKLLALCDKLVTGLGTDHSLPSNAAFVLATYAWKQGDGAIGKNRHQQAADWFLLAAHPVTRSIHNAVAPKSRRKAALSLTQLNKFDQAEEVLTAYQTPILARTEFARFNNFARAGKVDDARAALQRMVGGVDFEVTMLFWASDIAKEAPEHSAALEGAVLSGMLMLYDKGLPEGAEPVDVVTLTRCLIRTTVSRLETSSREDKIQLISTLVDHYKAGRTFAATQLGHDQTNEDELLKSVKWLYTSAHAVVTQATKTNDFPPQLVSALYQEIASLIEISQQLRPEPASQARLYISKLGALGDRIRRVREAGAADSDEMRAAYSSLLPRLHKLRLEVIRSKEDDTSLEGLDDLQAALVGMLVDGHGAMRDWPKLEQLIENFTEEQPNLGDEVLRACASKIMGFEGVPLETELYVTKLVLYQLQKREDVEVSTVASWLRLLIKSLIDQGEFYWDDAFAYINDEALELVRQYPLAYGKNEISWLSSQAWDKGCEFMMHANAVELEEEPGGGPEADLMSQLGHKWCEAGIDLARLGELDWHNTIKEQWKTLMTEQGVQG